MTERQGTEPTGASGEGRVLTLVLEKKRVELVLFPINRLEPSHLLAGLLLFRWGKEIKVNLAEGLNDPLALDEFLNGPKHTYVHPSGKGR